MGVRVAGGGGVGGEGSPRESTTLILFFSEALKSSYHKKT